MIPGIVAGRGPYSGPVPIDDFETLLLAHSPLGYWKLDESTGTIAVDSSGNGNHGTYIGSPTFRQGEIFPGGSNGCELTTSDYVTIPNGALVSGDSERTVGLFVEVAAFDGTSFLVSWGEDSNGRGYSLEIGRNGDGSFGINMRGTGWIFASNDDLFSTDEPLFLVEVYTGSRVQGYINGVQVHNNSRSSANTTAANGAIGRRLFSNPNPTPGKFSDVFILNKALDSTEVSDLYQAALGEPPPAPKTESLWVGAQT